MGDATERKMEHELQAKFWQGSIGTLECGSISSF